MSQDQELSELEVRLASEIANLGGSVTAGFIKGDAEGALPIGTIIEKCNSGDGDSYPDGTRGIVLASHNVDGDYGYFCVFAVEHPVPTLIAGRRIKELLLPLPTREG